jgi:hypothetical protein
VVEVAEAMVQLLHLHTAHNQLLLYQGLVVVAGVERDGMAVPRLLLREVAELVEQEGVVLVMVEMEAGLMEVEEAKTLHLEMEVDLAEMRRMVEEEVLALAEMEEIYISHGTSLSTQFFNSFNKHTDYASI